MSTAEPRTYDAWIRFSSSSGTPQPDSKLDGRGMAIKLMGVSASPSTTQDFVMINNPVFMVRNAIDYVDLQTKGLLYFFFPSFNPLRWRLHELMVTIAIFHAFLLLFGFLPKLLTEKINPDAQKIVNMAMGSTAVPAVVVGVAPAQARETRALPNQEFVNRN